LANIEHRTSVQELASKEENAHVRSEQVWGVPVPGVDSELTREELDRLQQWEQSWSLSLVSPYFWGKGGLMIVGIRSG
jgi:hypothetical protein